MTKIANISFDGRLWLRRAVLTAVCLLLAAGLMGCRPSHKLEKMRYTADADMVDTEQEQIDVEDDGRLEEYLQNVQQEEALKEVDEEVIAAYEAAAEAQQMAAQSEFDSRGSDVQATDQATVAVTDHGEVVEGATGDVTEGGTGNTVQGPSGEAPSGPTGEGEGSTSGEEGPETPDPDQSDQPNETIPTPVPRPNAATGSFLDDNTNDEIEVPVRVRKAAAVGPAAQLVEMIAGPGRLVGADAEQLSNGVAQRVFQDAGQVQAMWSGDGSTPISADNLAALLADENVGVVFGVSGMNSLTQAQVDQMAEYGLTYVTLYPFDSVAHLKTNARLVATVMARSDYDADSKNIAERYCSWIDSVTSEASSRTSAMTRYTTYIAGWDSEVTYQLSSGGGFFATGDPDELFGTTNGQGQGMAYGYTTKHREIFTDMGKAANVHNVTTISDTMIGHTPLTDYVYVAPATHLYRVVGGGSMSLNGAWDMSTAATEPGYAEFLHVRYSNGGILSLGESDFPAIIASSNEVANKVASDGFWTYRGYGGITRSFNIYVSPVGLGSWAEGSVDSPLEAVWLANRICGQYSESEVKSKVSDFYYQFYGVRLGTNDVAAILGM